MKFINRNSIKLSLSALLLSTFSLADDITVNKELLDAKCSACHTKLDNDSFSRISEQRKTPEGWFMTLHRMKSHGLSITKEEEQSIIKYLSDKQGIAPSESSKYRYILEQTPNTQEAGHDALFTEMCIRCHSGARVGIQRRTLAEWDKLVDFHLGRFPTTEYHALSRDREWFSIAKDDIVPFLAKEYNFNSKEWDNWIKKSANQEIGKSWILYGHTLAKGDFQASLKLKEISKDKYEVSIDGSYLDGSSFNGKGKAIIYSGYEYRASLNIDGISYKQVFTIVDNKLQGRMYESLHPEEGSTVSGVSEATKESSILAVLPKSVKAGSTQIINIVGNNLDKNLSLPKNVKLEKVISKSKSNIKLLISTPKASSTLQSEIKVGNTSSDFVVYDKVDFLDVKPSYAIARVGDGGGSMPKQHSIFEAYGVNAGKDGKVGTKDDIDLGVLSSSWRVEPFDDIAKHDQDIKYAGRMDSLSGRFTPSFAGPNPKRKFSTNNAGNLKVIATLKDSEEKVEGESHLIVTVQKWVNPPIN